MKLEGIHHITAITGDAQRNIDFYAGTMGLRLVKKTVNQDAPSVYHLFYADEGGNPGADLTFFEFRGAPRGRAGAGMVAVSLAEVAPERGDRIGVPTAVLWPEHDPLFPRDWSDRLDEFFSDLTLQPADGAGHFSPLEAPQLFAEQIKAALDPNGVMNPGKVL